MTDHEHTSTGEVHEHDLGLGHDLGTLQRRRWARRGVIGLLGGLSVAAVAGCGSEEATSGTGTPTSGPGGRGGPPSDGGGGGTGVEVADGEIPEETAGPYPGDGSNGPDALGESGIVRSDITSSVGEASGTAEGVPLTLRFRVYDLTGEEVEVLPGAALYAWHCDREGNYSMYDGPAQAENYLRGVQGADADGWLEFTTIFPGCYSGRWPHVHFEVYESLEKATGAGSKLRTSQLAFPEDVCREVYATDGYESSVQNLEQVSLDADMVFADGHSLQMASVTGANEDGWVATLNVPI
ncbi:MAG: intradiol ring-cleavage dioxygenase [Nocardioides sp.]|uniref:intradiol ring-cleavage dioxygenase n=1 Tax=Nocardioides sp. TaxID=35761 RepID=UPI003F10F235